MNGFGNELMGFFGSLSIFMQYMLSGMAGALLYLQAEWVGETIGKALFFLLST